MAREIPMKGAYEHDALSGWRRVLGWHPGMRALQKRSYNKRSDERPKGNSTLG